MSKICPIFTFAESQNFYILTKLMRLYYNLGTNLIMEDI